MGEHLNLRSTTITWVILAFLVNTFGPLPTAQAGQFYLPAPGQMVALSPAFDPAVLKGIKLDPQNPFRFHFFVDKGDSNLDQAELKNESAKLIKYFLASLTIPEKDLWVNLSPYEKDRIVPIEFGQTGMGRDLLAEDYLLKQITASLIYPESQLGKEFWQKVYAQAQAKYGTTNIPFNTFNKVWIVPDKAVVYENGGTAFVLENHLKVMLEEDYLALSKNECRGDSCNRPNIGRTQGSPLQNDTHTLASHIIREIVIPALTKEVNEGKNFSQLRQVFYSLILATWYKKKVKDSILNKVYSNRSKINGVNVSAQDKNRIYQEYLKAFKKGVYNYIKEDPDPLTGQTIPRKYFSGGWEGRVSPILKEEGPKELTFTQMSSFDAAQLVDETIVFTMTNAAMKSTDMDPLEFTADLHVTYKEGELARKNYPIYRIDDHHRVILKERPPDNVLRARFGYEMAHAIGFKGIEKVQIYSREGVFANIEDFWGGGLEEMVGPDTSYKLFEALNIINDFNDSTYGQLVEIFNSSLVRGDIYRLFSNYHADSYSDRNMRVVRLGDHYVIRWVDYDFSFSPSEYLGEYVDAYLKAHAGYFVRYGLDLIKEIVDLSDSDIEHMADDVYGKEAQQLLIRGKGVSETEAATSLQEFRTAVVKEVKVRRGQFRVFYNWLITEHKIPREMAGPDGREGSKAQLASEMSPAQFDEEWQRYENQEGLSGYPEVKELFSLQTKQALLDDRSLKPVFLQVLPPEAVGSINEVPRNKGLLDLKVKGGTLLDFMKQCSSFYIGDAKTADGLLKRSANIIVGVTDRYSEDTTNPLHQVANGRSAYFQVPWAVPDGRWLLIKGLGQFKFEDLPPLHEDKENKIGVHYLGLAAEEGAEAGLRASEEFKEGEGNFVPVLGFRRLLKVPDGKGGFVSVEELKKWDGSLFHPVLIFKLALYPQRLVKLPQLIKADPGLDNLRRNISRTLANTGRLPQGTELTASQLILMDMKSIGQNEAVKQHKGWFKGTVKEQDWEVGPQEGDSEEWVSAQTYREMVRVRNSIDRNSLFFDQGLSMAGIYMAAVYLTRMMGPSIPQDQRKVILPSAFDALKELFHGYFSLLDDKYLGIWATPKTVNGMLQPSPMIYWLFNMSRFHPHYGQGANADVLDKEVRHSILSWAQEEIIRREESKSQAMNAVAKELRKVFGSVVTKNAKLGQVVESFRVKVKEDKGIATIEIKLNSHSQDIYSVDTAIDFNTGSVMYLSISNPDDESSFKGPSKQLFAAILYSLNEVYKQNKGDDTVDLQTLRINKISAEKSPPFLNDIVASWIKEGVPPVILGRLKSMIQRTGLHQFMDFHLNLFDWKKIERTAKDEAMKAVRQEAQQAIRGPDEAEFQKPLNPTEYEKLKSDRGRQSKIISRLVSLLWLNRISAQAFGQFIQEYKTGEFSATSMGILNEIDSYLYQAGFDGDDRRNVGGEMTFNIFNLSFKTLALVEKESIYNPSRIPDALNRVFAASPSMKTMLAKQDPGGIDLNPAQMSMQVKKGGEDFKFNFNGTEIDAAAVTGATFTIRQMTPVTNLLQTLGLGV